MTVRGAKYPRKQNDWYRTPPETTHVLLTRIQFNKQVCDPACGDNAILNILRAYNYETAGSDLADGYNFLVDPWRWPGADIVSNPPYGVGGRTVGPFVVRALNVTEKHLGKVAMLLPVDFDSGGTRQPLFGNCRSFAGKIILTNRIRWFNDQSGSTNHAWYLWDHQHTGQPWIKYAAQIYPEKLAVLD